MKTLHVINIAAIAGAEKYLLQLLPELNKSGVESHIFFVYKSKDSQVAMKYKSLLEEKNIKVFSLEVKHWVEFKIFSILNKTIRNGTYDLIHTHLIYADFWASIIKRFYNSSLKIVSCKHGYHEKTYTAFNQNAKNTPRNFYWWIYNIAERKIDASYACSFGLKKFHEESGLYNASAMDVIHHGFDYEEPIIKNSLKFSYPQLLITGRLIPRKGHEMVFEILPQLITKYPDLILVILGTGEYQDFLLKKVLDLKLEKYVMFLGYQSEVLNYMASSDLNVIPSYCEGLPLVVMEAFQSGKPVVAFDTIGINEAIDHEKNGLLAKAFDTQDLFKQIERILENPAFANDLSIAGKQKKIEVFSLNKMTQNTISFYQKVLQRV